MSLEALRAAVLHDPDDLAPRLVYADALTEAGDPRGEFIVHHIAGRPEAQALLKQYGKAWIAFLHPAVSRPGLRFINGFVERITLKVAHLDRLPGFMDREPIREVRFRDLGAEARRLAAMPDCTRRITWLDLKQGHVAGNGFAALMAAPWDRLWRIWAPSNPIGEIGVRALIEASPGRLTSLNLHGVRLNDRTVPALAAWPGLARIRELNLRENDLSDEALAELLAAAPALRWVGLPVVGPATLRVLAGPPAKTIESLLVTQAAGTRRALKDLYGKRLVHQVSYTSGFDLPWP
jgi:uncharacterized protein (TIGR02996 family)